MDPIELSAISMKNDLERLETISNNVANLTTPGYKKTVAFTETLAAQTQQVQRQFSQGGVAGGSLALPVLKTLSDQSSAALKSSGNPLDLALEGDAYFELQGPSGTVYSKRGNFSLDNSGRLLLSGTQAVLNSINGGDIRVGSEPVIDELGRIFENDQQVDQIKLVSFAEAEKLISIGEGLFTANNLKANEYIDKPIVRQGFLETSNTEPGEEMVELVQLSRHIEATQQVIRGYDGMLETVLDDLGNF